MLEVEQGPSAAGADKGDMLPLPPVGWRSSGVLGAGGAGAGDASEASLVLKYETGCERRPPDCRGAFAAQAG
eukprot:CAMPEP_0195074964 /NCGR_PEP_ID=MMETSP0448-20130528/17951_1 /TAXON_ID=66468 /ORGANISM="Heterocapsa triquestra, Strain CCMP 448" /LENGTH=71 /DNA_ID=CAMNT_0040107287 /DNA_START=184 /DNA_END=396 /DNA_ORIENTATION=-